MLSNEELKTKLSILVNKYKALSEDQIEGMSEEDTRVKFIDKLLIDVLRWNEDLIERQKSVEIASNIKHPDYWYPSVPKIIVEAKKLKLTKDLEYGKYDTQVQNYAYSKAVNWAILTNFKCFKAWYITRDKIYPFCNIDLVNGNLEYILDKLTWFQSENLLKDKIEEEAKRRGIKLKEIDIAKDFSANLNNIRNEINNYFKNNYKKYNDIEREELTQGLINRLIFIKKLEAEGIEPNELEQIYRNTSVDTYNKVIKLFERYRRKYDTDIFGQPNTISELEKIRIWDEVIRNLLDMISKPKSGTEYNFSAIDVDVLGTIYENYLAYIQKGVELKGGQEERKEHGIYYTPKYIVDYIVDNTLGTMINDAKSNVKKLKILDPACGSGSFLIGSINLLDSYYDKELKSYHNLPASKKLEIIKNNIYGVDLDERAIQIAKLSIYLKLLTLSAKSTKQPITETYYSLLPELKSNIKNGNSLIDNPNLAGDKAFKWNEEFAEIINNGGFDVVVGNPPYIDYREIYGNAFLKRAYYSTKIKEKYNILIVFIEKGLQLLKEDGRLGFIVASQFLASDFGKNLRELILKTCDIEQLIDVSNLKIFKDASTYPVIIIIKKKKRPNPQNLVKLAVIGKEDNLLNKKYKYTYIKQEYFSYIINNIFITSLTEKKFALLKKIEKDSYRLNVLATELTWGTSTSGYGKRKVSSDTYETLSNEQKLEYIKIIQTADIQRYFVYWNGEYIDKSVFSDNKIKLFNKRKIVIGRLNKHIKAALDGGEYSVGKATILVLKDGINEKYVLGVLNSNLLDFYYKLLFTSTHMGGGYVSYDISYLKWLPIKLPSEQEQRKIIELVDKTIELNKELYKFGDKKTERRDNIESNIDRLNNQIENLIYKIYGITEEEKKIIEESLT